MLTIDEEQLKQLIKQAIVEVFEERREWLYELAGLPPRPLKGKPREELVALARRAEGTWQESEGQGTAVDIVRRLREEWTQS